jgi:hypothetical protein
MVLISKLFSKSKIKISVLNKFDKTSRKVKLESNDALAVKNNMAVRKFDGRQASCVTSPANSAAHLDVHSFVHIDKLSNLHNTQLSLNIS